MHKKQELSSVVSLSNSCGTKKRKHGFVNLCNENTMKCTEVLNLGEIILDYISSKFLNLNKITLLNLLHYFKKQLYITFIRFHRSITISFIRFCLEINF